MKFFDLLALIIGNLARRKGRVALTAIGVIIGTTAVVLLVSLGVGLQKNAESQLGGIGDLTRIVVYPGFTEGGGGVVIEAVPGGGMPEQTAPLNDAALATIAALPGVTAVIPQDYFQAGATTEESLGQRIWRFIRGLFGLGSDTPAGGEQAPVEEFPAPEGEFVP